MPADVRAQIPPDVVEIERALSRVAHLLSRARQHHQTAAEAGVPVDRAAVPILRLLAEAGPQRSGDIAARLAVEAPHVTRQVQRLEGAGYVERLPDPADRRAYRVRLTPAGREAVERVLDVGRQSILQALAGWDPAERAQLATLFDRMVDDFVRLAAERGILPR
ncbi:MarR family winged helix-turn-helix transcriptional regulator [Phytohabitans suffuscus]|uniref:MarR family transcriptional regulator n=1 Tax=Phytohabitans suffuscus TaxID=624315 RepID=A0A6F8YX93_9ACTN|nr:MarR family transcriptional regulator [Phytohabitans suffuscus]BCB90757.1 MarR family transcriptional regulator [Phytohabitans suffuscus]